ncbi:sensor histidine kinase [Micromonospora sp. CPCC 206061]|uniref:sensor histidine kinase n=1 Tax=Micromonospora sp. CPCC 206061 TaxID=3122410 RepID=UPI002FF0E76A
MSSNRRSSWSLRARLIATMVALLAVVSLIIGVVTTLSLRDYLYDQVDTQVVAGANRFADNFKGADPKGGNKPGGPQQPEQRPLLTPGQAAGTVVVKLAGTEVKGSAVAKLTAYGGDNPAADAQEAVLSQVAVDGDIHTVDVPQLGTYRAAAVLCPDGYTYVVAVPLDTASATVLRMIGVEVAVVAGGVLLAAGIGALIIGASLRPLRRVAATASRVAELPLDRGEVALSVRVPEGDTDPRTEVGQVGAALNRMLGHVANALVARQASETRVRQFVADASHELRTPLAAIRGYAEVTRRGREAVPPDVAHALRRVESESARMTTLVDDLLLLARLDSGRPLEDRPVDLSALLVDAVSDAHVAGPEHHWRLDVPEEAVSVPGDAARLHQVVANLLANARTHTSPGTVVTSSLSAEPDGYAVIRVTDNGPGVPPELQPEVFERFARGDSSRSRAAGSTGLGLAIVAAVVEAHHGAVSVVSRPGHTEFTVRLPGSQPGHS